MFRTNYSYYSSQPFNPFLATNGALSIVPSLEEGALFNADFEEIPLDDGPLIFAPVLPLQPFHRDRFYNPVFAGEEFLDQEIEGDLLPLKEVVFIERDLPVTRVDEVAQPIIAAFKCREGCINAEPTIRYWYINPDDETQRMCNSCYEEVIEKPARERALAEKIFCAIKNCSEELTDKIYYDQGQPICRNHHNRAKLMRELQENEVICQGCARRIFDRVSKNPMTKSGSFCGTCYNKLRAELASKKIKPESKQERKRKRTEEIIKAGKPLPKRVLKYLEGGRLLEPDGVCAAKGCRQDHMGLLHPNPDNRLERLCDSHYRKVNARKKAEELERNPTPCFECKRNIQKLVCGDPRDRKNPDRKVCRPCYRRIFDLLKKAKAAAQ